VSIARKTIEAKLSNNQHKPAYPQELNKLFNEKRGVFVTLHATDTSLRGCIGYPKPTFPLIEALQNAAEAAATSDPRFPPVQIDEMKDILVEVTVLTPPKLLETNPNEYPDHIRVGRDGLIAEYMGRSGLLLPQVPVELGWDEFQFLSQTCAKAGLQEDTWKNSKTKIYTFQGEVFREREPAGDVVSSLELEPESADTVPNQPTSEPEPTDEPGSK